MQGASDDIMNAKNMLYQHLTWDPDKTIRLCSKLALPLATPAVGVTPPVSPKSTSADGEHGVNMNAGFNRYAVDFSVWRRLESTCGNQYYL
jgi:hypothetical protein